MTTSPRVVPSTSLIPVSGPKRKRRGLLRRVFSRGPGMVSIIFLAVLIIVSVIINVTITMIVKIIMTAS